MTVALLTETLQDREEKSVPQMYGAEDDLSACPLFVGDYINWGFYDQVDLQEPITHLDRELASQRLYQICADALEIKSDDSFLEICCGKGRGLSFLVENYSLKDVSAIDQSGFYLEIAKSRIKKGDFLLGKFEEYSFKKSYNKVICIEAAQHFANLEFTIKQLNSILSDNGSAVFATFFGMKPESSSMLSDSIPTVASGIDKIYFIQDVMKLISENQLSFRIQSIGQYVFPGYDIWTSQTSLHSSWTRNWLRAYQSGLIDYFIIQINK